MGYPLNDAGPFILDVDASEKGIEESYTRFRMDVGGLSPMLEGH